MAKSYAIESTIEVKKHRTLRFSLGWQDKNGMRYHIWVDECGNPTEDTGPFRDGPVIYKNPPHGVGRNDPGSFNTRRLSIDSQSSRATLHHVRGVALEKNLYRAAEIGFEEAEAERAAKQAAARLTAAKEDHGPELFEALVDLLDVIDQDCMPGPTADVARALVQKIEEAGK